MRVRHIDGAGAKLDLFGWGRDPGEERDAGGDILGLVGDMFADIGLAEAELIGKQEGFAVLLQRTPPILLEGMDRHREETQLHRPAPKNNGSATHEDGASFAASI